MPPLPLAKVLSAALPLLSGEARAVLDVLASRNGLLPPANDVARFLGLRTRHQVARKLRRASLPPLEELAAWTRLFYWILQSEQSGASLLSLARQSGHEPATCYRLVRRLMGQPWSRVRRGGIAGAIVRFRATWRGSAMHQLTLQPLLRAAAMQETKSTADPVIQPVRPVKPAPSQSPGKPRGMLDSRLAIGGYPFDVAIGPDGVAWLTRVHVAVVDLVSRRRICSIAMEGNALGAALSPDERMLYVATNLDQLCACALSDNGGRIVRSTSLPLACTEIALHPAGNRVFVPTWKAGVILEFEARTLALVRRYEVGGAPLGVAVSRDGLRLYCGNEAGWLDLIHLPSGKSQRRMLHTPADEVGLTPDQSVVYVSLRPAGQVALLDAQTLKPVGTLETGGLPRHIAFDNLGTVAIIANEAGWV